MEGQPHRIVVAGEVLFDAFPDGDRLGGAPFNFAYHLHGLGVSPLLLTRVGRDERGDRIDAAMAQRGLSTAGLQRDPDHPTGWVTVVLDGAGGHQFTIHRDVAYDYLDATAVDTAMAAAPVDLFYFGTLACRAPASRAAILAGAAATPGRRLLDVNLRPDCWEIDQVRACLRHATVVKINDEEVATLAPLLGLPTEEAAAVEALRDRFALEAVILTRGDRGAAWCGGAGWETCATPQVEVVDTVGAGDAFAAVCALGLLHGWPPALCLERAAELAAAVCTVRGACPEEASFYAPFREQWGVGPSAPGIRC